MKLKKAVKLASKEGYRWVAVDDDGCIQAFSNLPTPHTYKTPYMGTFGYWDDSYGARYLGQYTGSKGWSSTLRGVL